MVEIFSALAAKELSELARLKDRAPQKLHEEGECAKRVVDFLRRAESHARINEYTWLIKGFYEIRQSELYCCSICQTSPSAFASYVFLHRYLSSYLVIVRYIYDYSLCTHYLLS